MNIAVMLMYLDILVFGWEMATERHGNEVSISIVTDDGLAKFRRRLRPST